MKRGQAATEFIMTYGWAILAVIAAISALAYFGVLSPGKYVPDKCLFKTGFSCTDFVVLDSGADMDVRFTVQNNMGEGVRIFQDTVNVSYKGEGTDCGPSSDITINAGATTELSCTISGNPGIGQQAKFNVKFPFMPVNGVYNKSSSGEISTTVQE